MVLNKEADRTILRSPPCLVVFQDLNTALGIVLLKDLRKT